ncbi:MAG TPA: hypothetical protein ENN03_11560 [bacterium]|nr:hypothetical protein [bacterium]
MIVKMKQVTLLISSRDRNAVSRLRKLGVLDVRPVQPPESEDIRAVEKELERVRKALSLLRPAEFNPAKTAAGSRPVDEILELEKERQKVSGQLEEAKRQTVWFGRWGRISLKKLKLLDEWNLPVAFYTGDKKTIVKLPDSVPFKIIHEDRGTVRFVTFGIKEPLENIPTDPMPKIEIAELDKEIAGLEKRLTKISKRLEKMAAGILRIQAREAMLKKQLEALRVREGMGQADSLTYLQGYCPSETVPRIRKTAERHGWGYWIQDPEDPRDVPTLIHNPRWLRIVQPLFQFMGTLPGYDEMDVSFVFLGFFSLFYAMLIGDAGYGLIFLGATLLASRRMRHAPREPFRLMMVLSAATLLWGMFSGTWFGSEELSRLPVLRSLVVPGLSSFGENSQAFLMRFSFIVGVVHLSIARILAAVQKINTPQALAELGWVPILWSIFFVADQLVLGNPMPAFAVALLIVGVVLVLFFSNYQKNIFKGILISLGDLPLSVINSFSDIVSYIRLFAVGFATVIVASSFNEMALGSGVDSVLSGLTAALILILGHGLNIMLGMMSVLVHGVRLNMLEFSGHLNMEWAGKPYRPFRE